VQNNNHNIEKKTNTQGFYVKIQNRKNHGEEENSLRFSSLHELDGVSIVRIEWKGKILSLEEKIYL